MGSLMNETLVQSFTETFSCPEQNLRIWLFENTGMVLRNAGVLLPL